MDSENLQDILIRADVVPLRKQEKVVESESKGDVSIHTVNTSPTKDEFVEEYSEEDYYFADCHFIEVAVHKEKAEKLKDEFEDFLDTYPHPSHFEEGYSYIGVGAELGSQSLAFEMFAMGEALGIWKILTPKSVLGLEGPQADALAGKGLIGVMRKTS